MDVCWVREIGLNAPNPRREAFRILRRVEDAGAFASVLLETRSAEIRDPREVALLTEIVLGVLRRRAPLDHAIAKAAARPVDQLDGAVLTAIRIGAYALLYLDRVPDHAAVDTAVARLRELPPLVTSGEIERLRTLIADAQHGKRFVLQGGDCAETLAQCTPDSITRYIRRLHRIQK